MNGWTIYPLTSAAPAAPAWTFVIARDNDGGLHWAANGFGDGTERLRYRYWNGDTDFVAINDEEVHSAPASASSILVDANGTPSMFIRHGANEFGYATRRDGTWQVVQAPGNFAGRSTLSRSGQPIHCFATTGTTLNVYRVECTRLVGDTWRSTRIVEDLRAPVMVRQAAVDSIDRIHLVFELAQDQGGALHYARETDTGWETQPVASGISGGAGIVIDGDDRPFLVYGRGRQVFGVKPLGGCGVPPPGLICSAVRCDACPLFEGTCLVCAGNTWQTTAVNCRDSSDGGSCDTADGGTDAGASEPDAGIGDGGVADAGG